MSDKDPLKGKINFARLFDDLDADNSGD